MNCKICQKLITNTRGLTNHIVRTHKITTEKYYLISNPIKNCIWCGSPTSFMDITRGYRDYCSVLCLNRHKATQLEYRKKLSISNKKTIKKKHSDETKAKISLISKAFWANNRQKMLKIFQSLPYREKISKIISEKGFIARKRSIVNGIRCDSSAESDFVNYCILNKIEIKRFIYRKKVSIKIGINWRVPDFIINKKVVVDVKAFHIWFINDLKNGLKKYIPIEAWCLKRGMKFSFWFQKYGFLSIKELLDLSKQEIEVMIKDRGKNK